MQQNKLQQIWLEKGEKEGIMGKEKQRVENAIEKALVSLDYIIDYRAALDFVEVTGRMGGDVITDRVYDDGSMYER